MDGDPETRVIVHSVHSQVPRTIEKLGSGIHTVIGLDSHLDVAVGEEEGDDIYPPELLIIAKRTSAHTEIRRILEANGSRQSEARLIVAIPERMLLRHVQDVESNLPPDLRLTDESQMVSSVTRFLARERGVETFSSPPKSLLNLVRKTGRPQSWVLDIDIDYIAEMRRECYTSIRDPSALQSMRRVMDFVRSSKPKVITVSEAKTSAIRDASSNFSRFLTRLNGLGYQMEEEEIAPNEIEVAREIDVCYEFYRLVSKKLMLKYRDDMMRGDFAQFRQEEKAAAKEFFPKKGYSY